MDYTKAIDSTSPADSVTKAQRGQVSGIGWLIGTDPQLCCMLFFFSRHLYLLKRFSYVDKFNCVEEG